MRYILIFLVLCSVAFASTMKIAILTDPHFLDVDTEDGIQVVGDPPDVRVFSTASDRMTEWGRITKKLGADIFVLPGDIISLNTENTATAENKVKAVVDTLDTEGVWTKGDAGNIHFVGGNHEYKEYEPSQSDPNSAIRFFYNAFTGGHIFKSTGNPNTWPSGVKRSAYWEDITVGSLTYRLIVLCWVNAISFDEFAHGSLEDGDQKEWLDEEALVTDIADLPVIVFAHGHFSNVIAEGWQYNNETMTAQLRTIFSSKTQANGTKRVKAVVSGHYHTGGKRTIGSIKNTIGGIDYYMLRGNVLGKNVGDKTTNKFYLFELDGNGVRNIKESAHRDGRGRYMYDTMLTGKNTRKRTDF